MTIITPETEKEDEKGKVVPFRVLTGGKGPSGDDIWMLTLPQDTVFVARNKKYGHCTQFEIFYVGRRARFLKVHTTLRINEEDTIEYLWEDPFAFSKEWDLIEVLKVP